MANRDNHFQSAFGSYTLECYPLEKNTQLRAWNAADELALSHLKEQLDTSTELSQRLNDTSSKILTINDHNGALSIPIASSLAELATPGKVHCWADSTLAKSALQHNASINTIAEAVSPTFIASTSPLDGPYDVVLLQTPKTLSLLEYQLRELRPHLHSNSLVIACGMVKHLHHSYTERFEQLIGPTHTSLAKKKARLILPTFDPSLDLPEKPPVTQYSLEQWPITLTNLSNVFAQNKLDIGTRFFLSHLGAEQQHISTIFDLGCGNGALGIAASQLNKEAKIHFYDVSYLAVSSAQHSCADNNIENETRFHAMDCLSEENAKADLILCNPPFHQSNTVGTQIAFRMFSQAKQHLTEQGELRIVGNRHLNYHIMLKKLFQHVSVLDSNKKFVVYLAKD
ncbi:hypothetical protein A9Q99_11970 [Gammaproteobacteria bacterium 45_16_T64]|nr:hypothetical protein A9Q99_11970 [Gammaproteobacteria bacterium 45_16_T64]